MISINDSHTTVLRYTRHETPLTTNGKDTDGCTNMRLTRPTNGFSQRQSSTFSVTKRAGGGAVRTPAQFVFFQIPVHPSQKSRRHTRTPGGSSKQHCALRKRAQALGAFHVSSGRLRTASMSVSVGSTCRPVNVATSHGPKYPPTRSSCVRVTMRAYDIS